MDSKTIRGNESFDPEKTILVSDVGELYSPRMDLLVFNSDINFCYCSIVRRYL